MKAEFWISKWKNNETGFHQADYNDLMTRYFSKLVLAPKNRVFVPLCGKTRDIEWLLQEGFQVVGAELSEQAVQQLFEDLNLTPEISRQEKYIHYKSKDLEVFVGDIFDLTHLDLDIIDASYDRAALVALPHQMRVKYCVHLMNITQRAPLFLLTFEYDQSLISGPPFSITADEVSLHYSQDFQITCLENREVEGGLKGKIPAGETAWIIR